MKPAMNCAPGQRLLDPACGSGVFLVAALCRALARRTGDCPNFRLDENGTVPFDPSGRWHLPDVVGFDLNPLAVLTARANYLIALGSAAREVAPGGIPVLLRDTILDPPAAEGPAARPFDLVVGNPPWIAWDRLSAGYRQATMPLWRQYGLFSLSGNDARHGGGKKDLAMLLTYVAADRHLRCGGRLAFVITQTVFQTKGAGDGFRRFRLGAEGQPLRVLGVHDLTALRPFAGAAARTATLLLEKGAETRYPVPYIKWTIAPGGDCPNFRVSENGTVPLSRRGGLVSTKDAETTSDPFMREAWQAEPVEPQRPSVALAGDAACRGLSPVGTARETASGRGRAPQPRYVP